MKLPKDKRIRPWMYPLIIAGMLWTGLIMSIKGDKRGPRR